MFYLWLCVVDTPSADGHNSSNDLFSDFMSAPPPSSATSQNNTQSPAQNSQPSTNSDTHNSTDNLDNSLFGDTSGGETKSTKESILALYGSTSNNQQIFGATGNFVTGNVCQITTFTSLAKCVDGNLIKVSVLNWMQK